MLHPLDSGSDKSYEKPRRNLGPDGTIAVASLSPAAFVPQHVEREENYHAINAAMQRTQSHTDTERISIFNPPEAFCQ